MGAGLIPIHSGALTVEEFCENHNAYARYYGWDQAYQLDMDGRWERREEIDVIGGVSLPAPLEFTEENGVLTGVSFSYELTGEKLLVNESESELLLCVMSFACAQSPFGALTSGAGRELVKRIDADPYESFSEKVGDVRVECQVEYEGYYKQSGNGYCALFPEEGEECYRYAISFSMYLEEAE